MFAVFRKQSFSINSKKGMREFLKKLTTVFSSSYQKRMKDKSSKLAVILDTKETHTLSMLALFGQRF